MSGARAPTDLIDERPALGETVDAEAILERVDESQLKVLVVRVGVSPARGAALPHVTGARHLPAHDGDTDEVGGARAGVACEREDGGRVRERVRVPGLDAALLGESAEDFVF